MEMRKSILNIPLGDDPLSELERIIGGTETPAQPSRNVVRNGEQRLMIDLLVQAIDEAMSPHGILRDGARAWLRDQPGFTAPHACESIGLDYEATMQRLEAQWQEWPFGRPQRSDRQRRDVASGRYLMPASNRRNGKHR